MTTPKEARELARIFEADTVFGIAIVLRDLANQVERLEAQRKELREASKRLIGSLSVMITDPDNCDDIIFAKAALKATQ